MSARSGKIMAFCCVNRAEFVTQETLIMKHSHTKMAVLAISLATAGPLLADDLPVRNCTWCHGASAQGVSMAPRLAGQRADYLANELEAFATHKRDEFLSTKYMWYATAHLDPSTARNLAEYFSALPPSPRRTATANSPPRAGSYLKTAFPTRTSPLARHAMVPKRRACGRFRA